MNDGSYQHKFLNLVSSEESSVGKRRSKSVLLSLISKHSTVRNAKDGFLFRPELSYTETTGFDKEEINATLLELISEKTILAIYSFSFDHETKEIIALPGFIAQPAEKKQTVFSIYSEIVENSVTAFQNYLQMNKKLDEDFFTKILFENLKQTVEGNQFQKNSSLLVFNILEYARRINFPHSPSADFFLAVSSDIIKKMKERNIAENIGENSFLIVSNLHLPDYYAWTNNFFEKEIISTLKKKSHLADQFEKIRLNEELEQLQSQEVRSANFIRMRALTFENYQQYKTGEEFYYPGWLISFLLIRFAEAMNGYFTEQRKNELESKLREIKADLKNLQGYWETLIYFIKENEEHGLMADIKKHLDSDPEINSIEWQFPEGKISAYTFIHGNIFRSLVHGMEELPKAYYWRILLLKNLIDQVDAKIKIIFEDTEFVKRYGRLIRKAYIEEIPWYLQIFVKLNIPIFLDIAFRKGKQKIVEKQKLFHRQNVERRNEKQRLIDLHSNRIKEKISQTEIKDNITKAINDMIYLKGKLPTFDMVAVATKLERKSLEEWIEKLHFIKFYPKKSDYSFVLYPLDQNWRSQADKLYRHIENKMEPSANESDKKILLELKEFLDKNISPVKQEKDEEDPYERFSKILKERESKKDDPLEKYF